MKKPYNRSWTNTTYEKSSIRQWLNNDFMFKAFTPEEQRAIVITEVTADKNPKYSTNQGNATKDRVFLLSIQEAEKYFEKKSARICDPTEYVISRHRYDDLRGWTFGYWWLRSIGDESKNAIIVSLDGYIDYRGEGNNNIECVRPAIWVDIESGVF